MKMKAQLIIYGTSQVMSEKNYDKLDYPYNQTNASSEGSCAGECHEADGQYRGGGQFAQRSTAIWGKLLYFRDRRWISYFCQKGYKSQSRDCEPDRHKFSEYSEYRGMPVKTQTLRMKQNRFW